MTAKLHITLFGAPALIIDGKPVTGFVSSKAAALAYYLAATNRVHSRDSLSALFWPDAPTEAARKNLRDVLSNLRRLIEPYLDITRQTAGFQAQASVEVDSVRFSANVNAAQAETMPLVRSGLLREAVQLYSGEFLQGCHVAEADTFEEWVFAEREHYRQLALQALHDLVVEASQRGAYLEGIDYATRLLALEPWEEEIHRQLMLMLAHSGQRGAALAQYETCRRILAEELGVEPADETVELYERLLATNESPQHNLPTATEPTPFVGRDHELGEINRRLAQADCRLLTLAGLGGVGKTRLALQVATANVGRFWDGVYFAPLTAISAPDLLVAALGEALGFTFPSREPPKAQLLNYLRNKNLLLVLDNFEQLLTPSGAGGMAGEGVNLLADLVRGTAGVKLLVTSRERLNLRAEWLFEVGGLPVPTVADFPLAEHFGAVQLFLQSARQSWAGFAPNADELPWVVRICQLVDGMPLGIELAAAWVQVLSCQEIAEEIARSLAFLASPLRDTPARHHSLYAVFDQSWRLLAPPEQQALARLAIFRGGFRREAAQTVAGAALSTLSTLVHKSLLRRDSTGRYTIHELLRQFVMEKLTDLGLPVTEAAQRHGLYFMNFLQQQAATVQTATAGAALTAIGEEIDNVRAAWQWAIAQGQAAEVGKGIESLYHFYRARNWFTEGEQSFRQAAEQCRQDRHLQGALAARQAHFLIQLGQYEPAYTALQQSLTLATAQQDWRAMAFCQLGLADVALRQGDYAAAQQAAAASRQGYEQVGDTPGRAQALIILGQAALMLGVYGEATHDFEQALALAQRAKLANLQAESRRGLGSVRWNQGDALSAHAHYQRAVAIYQDPQVNDAQGAGNALNDLGFVAWSQGHYAAATDAYNQALRLFRQIGDRQGEGTVLSNLGRVAEKEGNYSAAEKHYAQALQIARTIGDRAGEGVTLINLGFLAYHQGDYPSAQRHFAAALQVNAAISHRRWEGMALTMLGLLATLQNEHTTAHTFHQQALQIAQHIGDRPVEGYALTHLGYTLLGMGQTAHAQSTFRQALQVRQGLGDHDRALEAVAGLAQIALAQGDRAAAGSYAEQILAYLETGNLTRTLLPFQIYTACHQVLAAQADARATRISDTVRALVQVRAAAIADPQRRQTFLRTHTIYAPFALDS